MAEGPQALTTKRIALQFETTGIRGTTPSIYIIAGGKITPTSTKATDKRRVAGNRDPVLSTRKPETFKVSIPLPALIEDNGLGELLLATFGTDTTGSQLGSSDAYDHVFTANDTIKSFTMWLYDTLHPQSIRLCTIDQMKMEIDREKGIEFTFDVTGADMVESETFGSASYVSVATDKPKLIPPSQTILEYGNPQANISNYWKKITVTSKENPKYGAPGKAPVPAGASAPQLVVKGERDFTIDIDFIDIDGDELRRWRVGGDTDPSATEQADVQALTKFRCRSFGNQTKAATSYVWGYAHQANYGTAGTPITVAWGGAYTAGLADIPAHYEVVATATDTFKWRKDGGTWTTGVTITGAAQTLSDGVTVTFSASSGAGANDTWYGFSHYQRMIEVVSPTNVIEDVNYKDSTDFYEATVKLYHESAPSGTKPSMTLRNTKTSAYA
jgi:hypothetical protein